MINLEKANDVPVIAWEDVVDVSFNGHKPPSMRVQDYPRGLDTDGQSWSTLFLRDCPDEGHERTKTRCA